MYKTYRWNSGKIEERVLARITYWMDQLEDGYEPTTGDWCWEWLRGNVSDVDAWSREIGEGRRLVAQLKIDAPEATGLIEHMETRLGIYVSHIAWEAATALRREWPYHAIESVGGEGDGLDTGVLHGPAGRDIEWGCHRIPRFDH